MTSDDDIAFTAEYHSTLEREIDRSQYEHALIKLVANGINLQRLGLIIFSLTVIHLLLIASLVILLFRIPRSSSINENAAIACLLIDGIGLFALIAFCYMFERISKLGHLIFRELSESLEWTEINGLSDRIQMRTYLLQATLPFTPSNSGPGRYIIFNLLLSSAIWTYLVSRV